MIFFVIHSFFVKGIFIFVIHTILKQSIIIFRTNKTSRGRYSLLFLFTYFHFKHVSLSESK